MTDYRITKDKVIWKIGDDGLIRMLAYKNGGKYYPYNDTYPWSPSRFKQELHRDWHELPTPPDTLLMILRLEGII